ncbi:bacteriophage protein [Campylobacterota bacterium]|nr:bacteriophage protein [Campylobacterota bacterium]
MQAMAEAQWTVDYYLQASGRCPVREWLFELTAGARAEVMLTIELLERHGLDLGMPFVKPVEGKLYEVRAKDKDGIYRVFYFARTGRRFVMLHGFTKKTQQTPRKEIEIAKKRMKEIE